MPFVFVQTLHGSPTWLCENHLINHLIKCEKLFLIKIEEKKNYIYFFLAIYIFVYGILFQNSISLMTLDLHVFASFLTSFTCFIFYLWKAEMKRFANVDTSVLKQHYEKKVLELEHEKKSLLVSAVSVKVRLWLIGHSTKPFSTLLLFGRKRLRNWDTILQIFHRLLMMVLKSWRKIIFKSWISWRHRWILTHPALSSFNGVHSS